MTPADVTGPASSGDDHIAIFNGTSGKIIADGGVVIGNSGAAVPVLNQGNTFSGANTFTGVTTFNIGATPNGAVQVVSGGGGADRVFAVYRDGPVGDSTRVFDVSRSGTDAVAVQGTLITQSSAGQLAGIRMRTGASTRWRVVKSQDAETGGNAGSNLQIVRSDDTGNGLGVPIGINRATGVVNFETVATVNGVKVALNRAGAVAPEDFGATGTLNDTAVIQAFFTYLHSHNGSIGLLTKWYNITDQIILLAGTNRWTCLGIGKYNCGLKKNAATPGVAMLDLSCDNFTLDGFGIDANKRTYSSGNHGLVTRGANDFTVRNFYVYDVVSTGILLGTETGFVGGSRATVEHFHINGGAAGCSNGILMNGMAHSHIRHGFVENIHHGTPCIGIQFKGVCTYCTYSDIAVRQCFIGASTQGQADDDPTTGWSNRFSDITISEPNPWHKNDLGQVVKGSAHGVRLASGFSLVADGILIDGYDAVAEAGLDDFIAVSISNGADPQYEAGVNVRFAAHNCDGANSRALLVGEARNSQAVIEHMSRQTAVPITLDTGASDATILIGRVDNREVFAPWTLVDDNSGSTTNRVNLLYPHDIYFDLADDVAASINVTGVISGMIQVWTNGTGEAFQGWFRTSASQQLETMYAGVGVATGTSALSNGTGTGVDNKMNIAATTNIIYVKNRTGSGRNIGVKITSMR